VNEVIELSGWHCLLVNPAEKELLIYVLEDRIQSLATLDYGDPELDEPVQAEIELMKGLLEGLNLP
jgi:hypothetical protein